MIGQLRGRVVTGATDGSTVLDVSGVGYELLLPLGTLGRVMPDAEGQVTLHVHTYVREDALQLFGFATSLDRATA